MGEAKRACCVYEDWWVRAVSTAECGVLYTRGEAVTRRRQVKVEGKGVVWVESE
jgi:hypothetical protein